MHVKAGLLGLVREGARVLVRANAALCVSVKETHISKEHNAQFLNSIHIIK